MESGEGRSIATQVRGLAKSERVNDASLQLYEKIQSIKPKVVNGSLTQFKSMRGVQHVLKFGGVSVVLSIAQAACSAYDGLRAVGSAAFSVANVMGSPQKAVIDLYNHSKDQELPVSTPATLDSLVSKALSYLDEQVLSYFEVYTGKKPLFKHDRSIELIKALMEINGLEPLLSKILGLVNYNGADSNINDIAIYSFYQIYLMLKKSEIDCLDSEKILR